MYNEAGEVVAVLGKTMLINTVSDIALITNGEISDVFYPQDGPMTIRIPDQDAVGTTTAGYVDFIWDGNNINAQEIAAGAYFVKVTIYDTYDTATTIIKEIQVFKVEEYVRITIFNSAGEIVKRVEVPKTDSDMVNLEVNDIFYVDGGSAETTIKYGTNGSLSWDGKNALGNLVETGAYEVYVEVRTGDGYTVAASKTITVLNRAVGTVLGDVKCMPNPYVSEKGVTGSIKISWTGTDEGSVKIKIYNIAGELVDKFETSITAGFAEWDMKTKNNEDIANGYFIGIIEAVTKSGLRERLTVKLSIIRKY